MVRPSWEEYACIMALAARSRSEDPHTKVGAAILNIKGELVATGYNGLMPNMEYPAHFLLEENRVKKGELTIHAEYNAIKRCKDSPHLLASTINPCAHCAKDIAAGGIRQVIFITRNTRCDWKFLEIFDFYGVEYKQMTVSSVQNILSHYDDSRRFLEQILNNEQH